MLATPLLVALGVALAAPLPAQDTLNLIYSINNVDVRPARLSGPAVVYPLAVWRRQVAGRAEVAGVIDTSGRFEPEAFDMVTVPDSGLVEPVRVAMLASRFSPGRLQGKAVRTFVQLGIELRPGPPPNPTDLVHSARAHVAAGNPDSAIALVDFAADPLVRATPGVLAYAQLVRGLALRSLDRDSLSGVALDAGLAAIADLNRRGVDLAPVLKRLADSVRASRRRLAVAARSQAGTPTATEPVDRQPMLADFPPIEYPREMLSLRVGGTVIVELAVDSTGRPVPGTARVAQSPNPGLNEAALRVVAAATYRPALRGGRAVRVVLRQPVTFAP